MGMHYKYWLITTGWIEMIDNVRGGALDFLVDKINIVQRAHTSPWFNFFHEKRERSVTV